MEIIMKVYTLSHVTLYEGSVLLGIYQYLSQAQEAEYAWRLQQKEEAPYLYSGNGAWTEIREVTMGAAPAFESLGLGEEVER
jgi:hypothetical protein